MDVDGEGMAMEPPPPRRIVRLSEDVVNQIAAAEVCTPYCGLLMNLDHSQT